MNNIINTQKMDQSGVLAAKNLMDHLPKEGREKAVKAIYSRILQNDKSKVIVVKGVRYKVFLKSCKIGKDFGQIITYLEKIDNHKKEKVLLEKNFYTVYARLDDLKKQPLSIEDLFYLEKIQRELLEKIKLKKSEKHLQKLPDDYELFINFKFPPSCSTAFLSAFKTSVGEKLFNDFVRVKDLKLDISVRSLATVLLNRLLTVLTPDIPLTSLLTSLTSPFNTTFLTSPSNTTFGGVKMSGVMMSEMSFVRICQLEDALLSENTPFVGKSTTLNKNLSENSPRGLKLSFNKIITRNYSGYYSEWALCSEWGLLRNGDIGADGDVGVYCSEEFTPYLKNLIKAIFSISKAFILPKNLYDEKPIKHPLLTSLNKTKGFVWDVLDGFFMDYFFGSLYKKKF